MKGMNKYFVSLLLVFAMLSVALLGASGVDAESQVLEWRDTDTITINKIDDSGYPVKGAKFNIWLKENEEDDYEQIRSGAETDAYGRIMLSIWKDEEGKIVPTTGFSYDDYYFYYNYYDYMPVYLDDWTIKIEEVSVPDGYVKSETIEGKVSEVRTSPSGRRQMTRQQQQQQQQQNKAHVFEIVNKVEKNDFTINKTDENGKPLKGADFIIYGKGEVIEMPVEYQEQHVEQQQE